MFGLGPSELLIILVLILFFYGGKKLPQIGEGLGKGIREFKTAIKAGKDSTDSPGSITATPLQQNHENHPESNTDGSEKE